MRTFTLLTFLALAGCGLANPDFQQEADHQKCQDLGFVQGTEAYGNCRLQLESNRAAQDAADAARAGVIMQNYKAASDPFYRN